MPMESSNEARTTVDMLFRPRLRLRNNTIVIPGHGPVGGKSDVAEFGEMLVAVREKVAALNRHGRSLEEVVATKPTAAFDAKWGQFLITPPAFTGLVYQGV